MDINEIESIDPDYLDTSSKIGIEDYICRIIYKCY